MSRSLRRSSTVAAAVAVLSVTVPSGSTAGTAAAADDWGTLDRFMSTKLQACKVPVDNGQAWRIRLRLRTDEVRGKGNLRVLKGGESTGRRWRSGWIPARSTSPVGAVRVPRGAPRWTFVTGVETDGGGTSTSGTGAHDVGRC